MFCQKIKLLKIKNNINISHNIKNNTNISILLYNIELFHSKSSLQYERSFLLKILFTYISLNLPSLCIYIKVVKSIVSTLLVQFAKRKYIKNKATLYSFEWNENAEKKENLKSSGILFD